MNDFIRFEMLDRPADRKTDIWIVYPRSGSAQLGEVKFFGAWRKFCFFPGAAMIFDCSCLRDIAEFCEQVTNAWRKAA